MARWLTLAMLATLPACSDGAGEPMADGGTGAVYVSVIDDRVMATGDVQLPSELFGLFATTVDGITGLSPPSEYEPGEFVYFGVAYTPLMFRFGVFHPFDHLVTSERVVDVGRARVGRWTTVGDSGTALRVVLDGLAPWQSSDDLRLVSGNGHATVGLWNLTGLTSGASGATLTVNFAYRPLLDSDRGDDLTVFQSEPLAVYPYYRRLTRAGTGEVRMSNGASTQTSVTLAAAPEETHALDVRRSAFLAFEDDVSPRALWFDGTMIAIDIQPGGAAHGPFSHDRPFTLESFLAGDSSYANPRLLLLYSDPDFAGDVTFGNPFPPFWRPYLYTETAWNLGYLAPGTSGSGAGFARIRVWRELDQLAGAAVVPLVSPPRQLLVNGLDGYQDLTGVGLRPVLSWSPPAMGEPTSYEVTVVRLDPYQEYTFEEAIAHYHTSELSLTVTRDMMVAGEQYFAVITAVYQPGVDRHAHPFRESFPKGTADAVTGVMVP